MNQPHVLVLDDDPDCLYEVVQRLNLLRFRAVGCSSLAEAREALADREEGKGFTVLVLDMWLGSDREGGLLFATEARPTRLRPEIIFLTAHGSLENAVRTFDVTPFAYIVKGQPDSYDLLVEACQSAHQRWVERATHG